MGKYTFTQEWFHTCDFQNLINAGLFDPSKTWKILEIGCLEGSSSTYFSDHLMNQPDSRLVCVDPFDADNPTTPQTKGGSYTKQIFLENMAKSKNGDKMTLIEKYSSDFYKTNTDTFNIIYIDGSHLVEDVYLDFNECLKILEPGGIMWMDDYLCGDGVSVRDCIDKAYDENKDKLEIIFKRYQIGFKKNNT